MMAINFKDLLYVSGYKNDLDHIEKLSLPRVDEVSKVICSGKMNVYYFPGKVPAIYATDPDALLVHHDHGNNAILIKASHENPDNELTVVMTWPELPDAVINDDVVLKACQIHNKAVNLTLNDRSIARLSGRASQLNITHYGSEDLHAKLLSCQKAYVNIHGSGNIQLCAKKKVEAEINGQGRVDNVFLKPAVQKVVL